jgi:hypothetical protein
MRRSLLAGLACFVVLSTAAAQANVVSNFGVNVQSCVVKENAGLTNGINVVYSNTHPSPATEVDFLVHYRGPHNFIFRDTGTFTQYATINHNLGGALSGLGWSGPNPHLCTVQRVVLANGRVLGP